MTQMLPDIEIWIAKLGGAMAGSAISLAYVLPDGKREAAIRFIVGVTAGIVFGLPVGIWLASFAGIPHRLSQFELALMGAAFASLTIWTLLGVAMKIASRKVIHPILPTSPDKQDKPDA